MHNLKALYLHLKHHIIKLSSQNIVIEFKVLLQRRTFLKYVLQPVLSQIIKKKKVVHGIINLWRGVKGGTVGYCGR